MQQYDVGRINPKSYYAKLFPTQKPIDHTQIPTLKDVIRYVKQHAKSTIGFQIEIKTDPTQPKLSVTNQKIAAALEKILNEEGIIERAKIQAYDWESLLILQTLNPKIATAYLTDFESENAMKDPNPKIAGRWTGGYLLKNYHNSIPEMIKKLGGTYWDVEDTRLTKQQLLEAHQQGLKVSVWPWPEKSGKEVDIDLVQKLKAMGVDFIVTDRPDVIKHSLTSNIVKQNAV